MMLTNCAAATLSCLFSRLRNGLHLRLFAHPVRLLFVVTWCAMMLQVSARAQNVQHTANKPDQALKSEARVDPSTRGMNLSIPLVSYPGRAGLNLPVGLSYSSKLWRIKFLTNDYSGGGQSTYTLVEPEYAEHSVAGWTSSLDTVRVEFTGNGQYYYFDGRPAGELSMDGDSNGEFYVKRIHVHLPDGSTHELRKEDGAHTFTGNGQLDFTGTFYSVDSSRMRYDSNASGTSTLYLPDGSRYLFGSYNIGHELSATQYIDRNGNTLTYNDTMRQWTDTLGRIVKNPLPANPVAGTNTEFRYRQVGTTLESVYTLKWKSLANVLTTDPATGQKPPLHYAGDSSCRHDPGANPRYTTNLSPALFPSGGDSTYVCADRRTTDDSLNLFNPVVLAEVVLPTGQSYRFTYNVYGEIDVVDYPTGGYEKFTYVETPTLVRVEAPYNRSNRGVNVRRVAAGAGAPESVWQYGSGSLNSNAPPSAHVVHVIAPDNTWAERWLHKGTESDHVRNGYDDPLAGMAYEERTYTPPDESDNRALLRRALTKWDAPPPAGSSYGRDPRVTKQVQMLFDTAGSPLSAMTTMGYDADINVETTRHYDYATVDPATAHSASIDAITPGTLLRSVKTTYLVNDEVNFDGVLRAAYRERNLVGLPTLMQVYEGDVEMSPLAAQTRMRYDETGLASNPGVTNWTNPNAVRGNLTTTGSWLNTSQTWIESKIEYDGCGNVVQSIDPLGRVSKVEYSDVYRYAYPTRTTSPVPDPTPGAGGPHGASAAFETVSVYDLDAGVVTYTTDTNGQTTHLSYMDAGGVRDPLNRVRKVERPDGGWTEYEYNSTPGSLYVLTRTALDAARSVESYQYFDGLGRPSRAYSYDGSSTAQTWSVVNTEYDVMGRVRRVSNPYFTSDRTGATTPSKWTTNDYDALGRVQTVTMPDGAVVSTSYDGNSVEVTDQDGRKRSSETDGLGRLMKVYEAPNHADYNYLTTYSYDALDNLRQVSQGQQTPRSFVYDSLKRLTSATNPESGTVTYGYDANGNLDWKQDARGVKTDYTYDHLNRVVERSYSVVGEMPLDYTATPVVSYYYDGTGMPEGVALPAYAKGRMTAVMSAVSQTIYTEFDVVGRIKQHLQVTDGQRYGMRYDYDLAGNLLKETYPSGRAVETEYDAAGRLKGVTGQAAGEQPKPYASTPTYTAHGALSALKLGNNLWEHTSYNTRLQPTHIKLGTQSDNSGVLKLEYDYGMTNNNGNVRSQTITLPGLTLVQSYEYDEVNRLKSAREANAATPCRDVNNQETACWQQTFTYDQYGNRRFKAADTTLPQITSENESSTNPAISPTNNRITSAGYRYDAAGNLECDPLHACGQSAPSLPSYTYDGENRLATYKGGASFNGGATYSYDGDGKRVKKVAGVVLTVFVYDALGQLVAEYSSEAPAYNGTQYLTADNLGTPRVVTLADGTVKARHDYLPFGEEVGADVGGRTGKGYAQPDGVRQGYTGYEKDTETGLDYAQARYFASRQGRFTSADPLLASGSVGNPKTWNRYAYALNNPLRFVDPTGLIANPVENWSGNLSESGLLKSAEASSAYGGFLPPWPPGTHDAIIAEALPGISFLYAVQDGSREVDAIGGVIPITLLPSEAYKHAMVPGPWVDKYGLEKATQMAKEAAANFTEAQITKAQDLMDRARSTPKHEIYSISSLTDSAHREFGKGMHPLMDAHSPAHKPWQVYRVTGNNVVDATSAVIHHRIESRKPTNSEMSAMKKEILTRYVRMVSPR